MNSDLQKFSVCDECGSTYYANSSSMRSICPECAHVLYGYPPCEHIFVNKRCQKCHWDGTHSTYVKSRLTSKKKKRFYTIILPICIVLILSFFAWIIWANKALELNAYTIQSKQIPSSFDGFRIAQLSDLHIEKTEKANEKLLAMVREATPDIIVITGDMIDCHRTNVESALRFAEKAVEIAPCYYIAGNHESLITEEYLQLKSGLIERGITVLEDEKIELERNGETISLIGVEDPGFSVHYLTGDCAQVMEDKLQSLDIEESVYNILLSHRPELFDLYVQYGADLVFTGHAHGGQFRLPLIGGLYAPNQGIFPEYDSGLYTSGNTNMLVSRGIGNSSFPLRFNNRPEVILVELKTV